MTNDNRVVVIGSGPPGATAALFLARAGLRVLMLEAGARADSRGLTFRVKGISLAKRKGDLLQRPGVRMSGDADTELYEALAPGGLSNHWSCAVPRFAEEDFLDAARAGREQAWPVGYADLVPWYERVEPLLHIAGASRGVDQLPAGKVRVARTLADEWQALADLARKHGRSLAPMPYAYGADTTLTRSGTQFNSFVRLIEPELGRGRIEVRFQARAASLEWSSERKRVTAVTFRDRSSGIVERVPCRAVVVAGGAFNTPQILLESVSSDFPQGLGNEHGVVGRYLHDHPVGKIVIDLPRPMSMSPAVYLTRLELARSTTPLYAAAGMQWGNVKDLARSVLQRHPGRLRTIGFSVFGTMAPTRENYVALDGTFRGPDGASGLELHITRPPEATAVLEQARDQILQLLREGGWDPQLKVWKIEPLGGANHYAGTCRMHDSPEFGAVDRLGRLHSVRNVAVADSSVFTTGPEKNPVLTSMALAARASSSLADELAAGDL